MNKEFLIDNIKNFIDIPEELKGATLERKSFSDVLSIEENEEKTIICKISTIDVDQDGDMLIPMGCNTSEFQKNPVVLFAHRHSDQPVGKVVALNVSEKDITAKIKFADTTSSNEIWSLVKGGYLRASSIGFVVKRAFLKGTKDFSDYVKQKQLNISDGCKRIISEFVLFENSIVPLPSNTSALVMAISTKSLDISERTIKDMDIEDIKEIKEIHTENTTNDIKASKKEDIKEVERIPAIPVEPIVIKKIEFNIIRSGNIKLEEKEVKELKEEAKVKFELIKKGKII